MSLSWYNCREAKAQKDLKKFTKEQLQDFCSNYKSLLVLYEYRSRKEVYGEGKELFYYFMELQAVLQEIKTEAQIQTCFCFERVEIAKQICHFLQSLLR